MTQMDFDADNRVHDIPDTGTVSVRDGFVYLDGLPGATVRIFWNEHVQLTVNGNVLDGYESTVSVNDEVTLTPRSVPPSLELQPSVSEDGLELSLAVGWKPGYTATIADVDPAARIEITGVAQPVRAGTATVAQLTSLLDGAGVVATLDNAALQHAITHIGESVVVGLGVPPVHPVNGWIEHHVDQAEVGDIGVVSGTALCTVHPPKAGVPGISVFGDAIPVVEPTHAQLRPGPNVWYDKATRTAFAATHGAPEFDEQSSTLSVCDTLLLDSVLGVHGPIEFKGHVIITDDVESGAVVRAGQTLTIFGSAEHAQLESEDKLTIHGSVISSRVRAGGDKAIAAGLIDILEQLPEHLEALGRQAQKHVFNSIDNAEPMSFALSVQLLLEGSFRHIPSQLDVAAHRLEDASDRHVDLVQQLRYWKRSLMTAAINTMTVAEFDDIHGQIELLVDTIVDAAQRHVDLIVGYVQSSDLEATGSIFLVGRGAVNSHLTAWGNIVSECRGCAIRGGSVTSHGAIDIDDLGSPRGSGLAIQLGVDSSLHARLVHAGTTVIGPAFSHRFNDDRADVTITSNSSGVFDVISLAA